MILKNNYEKNMTIKIFITYFLIIIHILFGLLLVLFFPLLTNNYRNLIIKIWCSVLLRILAVEIDIHNLQLVKNKDVFLLPIISHGLILSLSIVLNPVYLSQRHLLRAGQYSD